MIDLLDSDEEEEFKKVKFDELQSERSHGMQSHKYSVASEDLFTEGVDDILFEGELMKFKPGVSCNYMSRYVQISLRAFRYYRSKVDAILMRRPVVAFRKNIISKASPYEVNKASYLKNGSRIAKSGTEDKLFDNMFEIELNANYEDYYHLRDLERATKEAKDRDAFREVLGLTRRSKSAASCLS